MSTPPSEAMVEAGALAIQNSIRGMHGLPPLDKLAEPRSVYETHARACLSAAQAVGGWKPPEGYVLVPRVPTEAMIEAYCRKMESLGFTAWVNATTAWPVLLAAAPPSPEGE